MVRAFVQRHGLSPTLTALVLSALTVLMAVRFIGLTEAPPGFYVDEAAIAAQIICVRTTGADADGNPWPLFADVLGGGQVSPPTLYLGALWTALLGDGVASFRSLAGAAGVVILISLALVTWRLGAQPLAVPAIRQLAMAIPPVTGVLGPHHRGGHLGGCAGSICVRQPFRSAVGSRHGLARLRAAVGGGGLRLSAATPRNSIPTVKLLSHLSGINSIGV